MLQDWIREGEISSIRTRITSYRNTDETYNRRRERNDL